MFPLCDGWAGFPLGARGAGGFPQACVGVFPPFFFFIHGTGHINLRRLDHIDTPLPLPRIGYKAALGRRLMRGLGELVEIEGGGGNGVSYQLDAGRSPPT